MKAKLAYYKAKGSLLDLSIRIWTNSPYLQKEKKEKNGKIRICYGDTKKSRA